MSTRRFAHLPPGGLPRLPHRLTDAEMLKLCLDAFEAIRTADTSEKFMHDKVGTDPCAVGWGNDRRWHLAFRMQQLLKQHLLDSHPA
jgi:hypothetical protein